MSRPVTAPLDAVPLPIFEIISQFIPIKQKWLLACLNHSLRILHLAFAKQTPRFCMHECISLCDALKSPSIMQCLPYVREVIVDILLSSCGNSLITDHLKTALHTNSLKSLRWTCTDVADMSESSDSKPFMQSLLEYVLHMNTSPNLRQLDIHDAIHHFNPFSSMWNGLAQFKSLSSLTLSIPHGMRFETLEPLLQFIPESVTHLKCDKSASNGYVWAHAFRSTSFLPLLKHFDCPVSFPGVGEALTNTIMQQTSSSRPISIIKLCGAYPENIAMFSHLTSISLVMGADDLTGFDVLSAHSLSRLKSLYIDLLEPVSLVYNQAPRSEVDIMPLLTFLSQRHIEHFGMLFRSSNARHCMSPLSDDGIQLLASMGSLISLKITQVDAVFCSNQDISSLLTTKCWNQLHELEIHAYLTDANACALVAAAPHLRSLTLDVSAAIIAAVSMHCPEIVSVSLISNSQLCLSDIQLAVARDITSTNMRYLRHLHICQPICDNVLHALFAWLTLAKRLSYLEVSNPARLPSSAFTVYLQRMLPLKAMLTCCESPVTKLMQRFVNCQQPRNSYSHYSSDPTWHESNIVQSIISRSTIVPMFIDDVSRIAFFESVEKMLSSVELQMLSTWNRELYTTN